MSPRPAAALVAAAVATTALTLTGMATSGAQAADDTPGYSLEHVTVSVVIGPDNDQTCLVDADIYKPECQWANIVQDLEMPDTLEQRSARGGVH